MEIKQNPVLGSEGQIAEKVKAKRPNKYFIILLNDDYTPMEFVIFILKTIFFKSETESEKIMMEAHEFGEAICGLYPLEIAISKLSKLTELSEENGYPLKCRLEEERGNEL